MNKLNISALRACLGLIILASTELATAAVINYDESADGDLGHWLDTTFNFDIGINTVTGSTGWPNASTADLDSFTVFLSPNTQIVSITYEFSNVTTDSGTNALYSTYQLRDEANNILGNDNTDVLNDISPNSILNSLLPLGDGTFAFENQVGKSGIGAGGSWDYVLSIEVSSVPVPAAVWLFGSGLIGLIGLARRKV